MKNQRNARGERAMDQKGFDKWLYINFCFDSECLRYFLVDEMLMDKDKVKQLICCLYAYYKNHINNMDISKKSKKAFYLIQSLLDKEVR